jgi:hypothetical protein
MLILLIIIGIILFVNIQEINDKAKKYDKLKPLLDNLEKEKKRKNLY